MLPRARLIPAGPSEHPDRGPGSVQRTAWICHEVQQLGYRGLGRVRGVHTKYYVLAHLPPSYNDWQAHAPADINFGVIDYRAAEEQPLDR